MNRVSPSPQDQRGDFNLDIQGRERFLQLVLRSSCIVGLIAILVYLFTPSSPAMKFLAILTYGILMLITWFSRLAYRMKATVFLLVLFFSGFTVLIDYGTANAGMFFVTFIVMYGLLFSPRTGIYYILGAIILILLIFGMQSSALGEWARAIGFFAIVATIAAIGLHASHEQLANAHAAAQQRLNTLLGERSTLEQRVQENQLRLAQKTEQLRAISYIARKTAEVQDLAVLLDTVVKLVTDQFGFYHTGVFLLNETGDQAVLQAASSEGGRRMVERGHSLAVGSQGLVGYVAAQRKPRISLDVGEDAVFFNNPDLPMTRSELALPLLVRNKVLGAMDIQSDKPQAFTSEDVDVLQTLSDQVAIAIENARLMDETQAAIVQLEALTGTRTRSAWNQKLREKGRVFTYTPLGLRAEKIPQDSAKAIQALIMLRGQKIGTISIAKRGGTTWSKLDKDLIEEVASQVGLAVDNIRLLEEATQRAKQEQTIGKLAARFSQSLDLDTLLQTAARELGQLPDISEVSVFIGSEAQQVAAPKQRSKQKTS